MEIQVKEGGTSLHKTIREINLVYKGLMYLNSFIGDDPISFNILSHQYDIVLLQPQV